MLLKFCVKEFIEDREFQDLSKYTVKMYKQNLNGFLDYALDQKIVDVEEVKSIHVKGYLHFCKQSNNKISTINNKLRTLKIFFNFLVSEDIIDSDNHPARKAKYIKEHSQIEVFSDYHIRQMLNYYERRNRKSNSITNVRARMMIVFLLGTACRRGELVNIKWSDIDFDNQVIRVIGKKRQVASIPFTKKLKKELAEYKIYLQNRFGKIEYLFPSHQNRQLTDEAVSTTFKNLKKIMNFQDVNLSCHVFRHTFAQRALLGGMDVLTLQKILRHESLDMTQLYVNLFGTALAEQNDKFNPLNKMDI